MVVTTNGDKGHVGEELCGRRTGEIYGTLVLDSVLRTGDICVGLLEVLIKTVLGGSLHGVTEESRSDTGTVRVEGD